MNEKLKKIIIYFIIYLIPIILIVFNIYDIGNALINPQLHHFGSEMLGPIYRSQGFYIFYSLLMIILLSFIIFMGIKEKYHWLIIFILLTIIVIIYPLIINTT